MKTEFYKCNPMAVTTSLDQNSIKPDFLITLGDQFNDPGQWDMLSKAQQKVEQVKGKLQDNLRKITANRDAMIDLDNKTTQFAGQAREFEKESLDLQNMMWWRSCKLWLIMGCVVVAILCYIFVPIIVNATK